MAALLAGHLRIVRGYRAWRTTELHLEPVSPLRLAHDGETTTVTSPATLTRHPAGLAVFQPDPGSRSRR